MAQVSRRTTVTPQASFLAIPARQLSRSGIPTIASRKHPVPPTAASSGYSPKPSLIYRTMFWIFARPENHVSSPFRAASRMAYNSSRKAGTKLPGPRTYSLAAAFSAAISNMSTPESAARSLSVRCTVRKQPETTPRAQPVFFCQPQRYTQG